MRSSRIALTLALITLLTVPALAKEVVIVTSFPKELFETYKKTFEAKNPGINVVINSNGAGPLPLTVDVIGDVGGNLTVVGTQFIDDLEIGDIVGTPTTIGGNVSVVFGEGPRKAEVMFVGEQPGDAEDLAGHPFVGPAGRILDRALEEAGIDRGLVYVTNVVKHFKWEPRGKRRIHAKPNAAEVSACRPWLETEIALVKPRVLVCLGATAAQALLGRGFKVSRQRGEPVPSSLAPVVMATVHPSSILRAPDDEARREEMERFVEDLRKVAAGLAHGARRGTRGD